MNYYKNRRELCNTGKVNIKFIDVGGGSPSVARQKTRLTLAFLP